MGNSNTKRREKLRKEFLDKGAVVLKAPLLLRTAEYGIRFFLGAILAGGEILGGCAPFGLGFVGASGPGISGFCALLGSCFGYFLTLPFSAALKYIAASILIFAVAFAFFDVRLYQKPWFMPMLTAFFTAATGFIYLPNADIQLVSFILFGTEVLLAGASAYFYKIAFSPWTQKGDTELTHQQFVCLLLLGMTVLITLSKVELPGSISVGRLLAALVVMVAAFEGGLGKGSAVGVSMGLAMDLAGGASPFYTMAFGFSGLMAGIVSKQGRLFVSITYVLSNGLVVLWALNNGISLSILYEVFIASIVFMILPEKRLFHIGILLRPPAPPGDGAVRMRTYVKERLEAASAAFRDLYESIRTTATTVPPNDNDTAAIFDRAANRVCHNCPMWTACWQRGYVNTFNALNDASKTMMERGRAEAEDFPPYFTNRCMRFPRFLAATNEELTALLYRRQYHGRLLESHMAVCRQYAEVANILGHAASELAVELQVDPQQTHRLSRFLQDTGIDANGTVYYDEAEHLRAEVEGKNLSTLDTEEVQEKLATLFNVPLQPPQQTVLDTKERLTFAQAEPLTAVIGIAAKRKAGETVSGDSGTYFKTQEGTLYLMLADGMGSGPAAAQESQFAVRTLERFLKAGILPEPALKTLNSALLLRSETEGGFTTLDLMEINLFTGQANIYKYGAAPSYLRKKKHVRRIAGNTMPAGLSAGGLPAPDVAHIHVESGDLAVFTSDGILSGDDDKWLRLLISEHDAAAPRDLARNILEASEQAVGNDDDKTVMVLQVGTLS